MATVVWLGSPDGPDEVEFMGERFPKGKSVEVENEGLLARASANHFFKVEGYEAPATKHDEPVTYRPPSEQSALGPVPKAGDPIVPEGFQIGGTPPVDELPPPPEAGGNVATEGHHPAVRAVFDKPKGKK